MSLEGIQTVFGMAITDSAFRQSLLDSPAKAIDGLDLTAEEFAVLTQIQAESLDEFAAKFETWRLSRAVGWERSLSWHPREESARKRMAG